VGNRMHSVAALTATCLAVVVSAAQPQGPAPANPELRAEWLRMRQADQAARDEPNLDARRGQLGLSGVWRGTSTCTDRAALPACNDEIIVYEFTPGTPAGTVRWSADRITDGRRVHMGEFDLTYDAVEAGWKVEFTTPRFKGVWRLSVDGSRMSGTLRLLPGNETVRKVDLRKD